MWNLCPWCTSGWGCRSESKQDSQTVFMNLCQWNRLSQITHNYIKLSIMFWTESFFTANGLTDWHWSEICSYCILFIEPTKTPSWHQNLGTKVAIKLSHSTWRDICLYKAQRLFCDIAWWFFFISVVSDFQILNLALVSKRKLWYCDSTTASTPFSRHLSSHSSSLAPFPSLPSVCLAPLLHAGQGT